MVEVLEFVGERSSWRLEDLERLGRRMAAWSQAIGAPKRAVIRPMETALYCLTHPEGAATATYAIRSEPTVIGKRLWIEMHIENLTSRDLYVWWGGSGQIVAADGKSGLMTPDGERQRESLVAWGGGTDGFGIFAPHDSAHFTLGDIKYEPFNVTTDSWFENLDLYVDAGRCDVRLLRVS